MLKISGAQRYDYHGEFHVDPGPQQADLSAGVKLQIGFPDPKGRLETAYEDLRLFLAAGNVSCDEGKFLLGTVEDKGLKGESFRLEVQHGSCRIFAGDVDGVRRGHPSFLFTS